MKISKYQGAGNDFVIIEKVDLLSSELDNNKIQSICNRRFGVGSDGLLVLAKEDKDLFSWDFFNADGSSAEMCGNAARCVMLFLKNKYDLNNARLKTLSGEVALSFDGNLIQVEMKAVAEPMAIEDGVYLVLAGVPHIVLVNKDIKDIKLLEKYRWHASAGKAGANVSFLTFDETNIVYAQSFERGVENFTLACGTGALACGKVYCHLKGLDKVEIHMPGGALLTSFHKDASYLSGHATRIMEGVSYV